MIDGSRGRRWRRWGVCVLVGGIVVLLLAEVGMRAFAPQEPPGMYISDPQTGFRLAPDFRGVQLFKGAEIPLEFNSWGMRDREFGDKRPGCTRVLVLGDSFMFGYGVRVEQSFPKLLEARLRRQLGADRIEVVNAGISRYGTAQELFWFQQIVDRVQPDVVVLAMFVSNDIIDNSSFGQAVSEGGEGWKRRGLMNWLRVRSQLLIWLRHQRSQGGSRQAVLARRAFLTHARDGLVPETKEAVERTESYFRRLIAAVSERRLPFYLALIPEAVQVDPRLWQAALQRFDLEESDFDRRQPGRRFADLARSLDVPVVDLFPALEAHNEQALYFKLHWNEQGHAVAMSAFAEFLLSDPVFGKTTGIDASVGSETTAPQS